VICSIFLNSSPARDEYEMSVILIRILLQALQDDETLDDELSEMHTLMGEFESVQKKVPRFHVYMT